MATHKVLDSLTGQVLNVPDEQLGQYGIQLPTMAAGQLPGMQPPQPQAQQPTQPQQSPYSQQQYQQDLQSDIQRTGGKHVKEIKTYFDAMNPNYQKNIDTQNKKLDAVNTAKSSIQNLLDAYGSVPSYEKGPGNISQIPFLGGFTKESEYEKQKQALAAQLEPVVGAGSGTGLHVTQAELKAWSGLLPGGNKTDAQKTQDIVLLDKQLKDKFGAGLDPEYLAQYGVGGQAPVGAQPQGPAAGGLLQNAGQDAGSLINGILNIPHGLMQYGQQQAANATSGDPVKLIQALYGATPLGMASNAAQATLPGVAQEYNQAAGNPGQGGDILGRIGQRAYQKPVSTALDLIPFLQAGKLAMGAKGATAADAGAAAGGESGFMQRLIQGGVQKAADLSNGGGSKEYLTREAAGATAQNKILLDEGVLAHPTEAGKIKAVATKLNDYGSQLRDVYQGSDRVFKDGELGNALDSELKAKGWGQKDIDTIKRYINNQGSFDIGSQQTLVTPEKAWTTAQKLERNPPKVVDSSENAASLRKLSADAARVLRQRLSQKLPETQPLNERYSALRSYQDSLPDQASPLVDVKGKGLVKGITAAAQSLLDPVLQAGYTGSKLTRDMRFRAGNFVPKK